MAQAFGLVGQDLVEKGQLTLGQLDKAQKVVSALERGEIDIRGLVECSGGKSGYSLLDFLITPARARGDCTVPSVSAGDAFITLTQDEKIACIELLSGLAKDYLRKQLDGTGNAQVPEWVSEVAGQIRKIEVDYPNARELLVSFGLAGDSIRELAIYKLGGAESVATYRQFRSVALQYGEVAESAISAAVDAVATEKGLSAKDRADLKLLATTGVFATVAMVGVKGGAGKRGVVAQYGPLNKGPLPDDIAQTFRSGTYREVVTTTPTRLYRAIADNGNPAGGYWTRTKPEGPLQSVIDSALDQKWGNSATRVMEMEVPPGTKLFEGVASPQGSLAGGGNQVYFDKYINPLNPSWIK